MLAFEQSIYIIVRLMTKRYVCNFCIPKPDEPEPCDTKLLVEVVPTLTGGNHQCHLVNLGV